MGKLVSSNYAFDVVFYVVALDAVLAVGWFAFTGKADGAQWALGGDTWVVGCKIPDCTVFPEFNSLNPDMQDDRYNTELGMYQPYCGMDNLNFAYGHDEYLYRMVVSN